MADEITVLTKLQVVNGDTVRQIANRTHKVTQATAATGPLFSDGELTVPTTHEAIPFGDVATPGEVYIRNMDSTNYIQIGTDDTGSFVPGGIKIEAGGDARFRADDALTLYWRANTAAVKVTLGVVAD